MTIIELCDGHFVNFIEDFFKFWFLQISKIAKYQWPQREKGILCKNASWYEKRGNQNKRFGVIGHMWNRGEN